MIPWLDPNDDSKPFPDVESALSEPDGLLAAGGSLRPERLLLAYHCGIFPWFNKGEPILWWCPSQRAIIYPDRIHISRSLQRLIRKQPFTITRNKAFREVMLGCAEPRKGRKGTWITADMLTAYYQLFKLGYAHSVECWQDGKLAGGIYGVQLGHVFFGESMFSRVTNASKIALIEIARQKNVALIDCQLPNDHLTRMGMTTLPRQQFIKLVSKYCTVPNPLTSNTIF
ncbi:MAG TPA: leucyl/phenylalanyl-tRNA--protein transferase [Gammaproteobacteria bacterium]